MDRYQDKFIKNGAILTAMWTVKTTDQTTMMLRHGTMTKVGVRAGSNQKTTPNLRQRAQTLWRFTKPMTGFAIRGTWPGQYSFPKRNTRFQNESILFPF